LKRFVRKRAGKILQFSKISTKQLASKALLKRLAATPTLIPTLKAIG